MKIWLTIEPNAVFFFFTHSAIAVGERFESILKVVWGCWADAGVFRHTFRGVWTGQLVLRNSHQLGRFDLWLPWWRGPSPSRKGGGWFWTLHKRDKGAGHAAVGVGGFPGAGCNTQALEEVWWPSSLQMELLNFRQSDWANFRLHFSICLIFQEHQDQKNVVPTCVRGHRTVPANKKITLHFEKLPFTHYTLSHDDDKQPAIELSCPGSWQHSQAVEWLRMAVAVRLNNVQWTSMLLKPIKGQNLAFQLWQQMKFPRIWKDCWWWSWWPESCVDRWRSHNRNSGVALARRSSTRASWDQSWHWSARSVFLLRSLEAGHWQLLVDATIQSSGVRMKMF